MPNSPGSHPCSSLVCFAVKEEAKPLPAPHTTLITGMGPHNAASTLRRALALQPYQQVLSCGFAGGLNPRFRSGDILFSKDCGPAFHETLIALGAFPATFHSDTRVATTVAEKEKLWRTTSADAVEMESAAIGAVCREQNVPFCVIRVISDTAQENLPLDFNALMSPHFKLNYPKLLWQIIRAPRKLPALRALQKQTSYAAQRLNDLLRELLARLPN